ncbi:MAG: glycosyltransferase, partial [Anaerolineae bacterium]|nr:glycosyltransferase [Anaerolineae bacterium]
MGTITIAAIGSRGDVQPFVALGSGLRRAGYDVRIVAGDEYESLVRGYGLDFWSLGMHMMDTFAGGVDRALESG